MKRTDPIAIGDLISAMIDSSERLKTGFAENKALQEWKRVAGRIADETKDVYLRDGVLWVVCSSAAVRNEIMMRRSSLVAEINNRVGQKVVNMIGNIGKRAGLAQQKIHIVRISIPGTAAVNIQ